MKKQSKKMKYTKKQLVKAMRRWNDDVVNQPNEYEDSKGKTGKKLAEAQVDCLLKFVK